MGRVLNKSTEQTVVFINGKAHQAALWIETDDGAFYFDRVAYVRGGSVNLDQLRKDECLLAPGLIYRFRDGDE